MRRRDRTEHPGHGQTYAGIRETIERKETEEEAKEEEEE